MERVVVTVDTSALISDVPVEAFALFFSGDIT